MKNIEWLKEEVYEMMPSHSELYDHPDYTTVETVKMLDRFIGLIDQVEQPALPVIPDYVAEYIERSNERGYNVFGALQDVENGRIGEDNRRVHQYIFIEGNLNLFIDAYRYGYTVEEKRYWVVLPNKDSEGYKMYLTTTNDGELDEEDLWFNTEVEKEHYSDNLFKYEFTKQEIKKINNGIYWPFAKEVK